MSGELDNRGAAAIAAGVPSPGAEVIEALKNDLLTVYKAVIALEKRVNDTAVSTADVRPRLVALKVHAESFPNAMRELRRSQAAVEKGLKDLDVRVENLEARIQGSGSSSAAETGKAQ